MADDLAHLSVKITAAFSGFAEAAAKASAAFSGLGEAMAGLGLNKTISPELADLAEKALIERENECFGLSVDLEIHPVAEPVDKKTRRIDFED
jgi:hypothetical protein